MVDPKLKKEYERVIEKVRIYNEGTRNKTIFFLCGYFVFLASIIPAIPMALSSIFGYVFFFHFMVGGVLFGAVLMIGGYFYPLRFVPPEPSLEEKTFLDLFPIFEYMDEYFRHGYIGSRKKASKRLSKIIRRVKKQWRYGNLELARKEIGVNSDSLKENLEEILLPIIKESDGKDLKTAYAALEDFCRYLLNPSSSELQKLNQSISSLSEIVPVEKPSVITTMLKRHPYLQHCLILIGFIALSVIAFFVGANVLKISVGESYIAAITLLGILVVAYITLLTKR